MPLTINLLHEQQFLSQQRKRDPLKLGLYALAGVAALFVMYYGWRLLSSSALDSQLKARQSEWAKQEPAANAAHAQEKDLTAQVAAADVVSRRIDNRFYWARARRAAQGRAAQRPDRQPQRKQRTEK